MKDLKFFKILSIITIFFYIISSSPAIVHSYEFDINLLTRESLINTFTEALANPDHTELAYDAFQALTIAVSSEVFLGNTAIALITIMNTENIDPQMAMMSIIAILQAMPIYEYNITKLRAYGYEG